MAEFIELAPFSRARAALLDDEAFRALQTALLEKTTRIDAIPHSGGLLKARWGREGSGKRGGLRIIYFHYAPRDLYYLLALYPKSDKEDLSVDELRMLKRLVDTLIEALERDPSSYG